jgi:putative ABC transport system substrate-binding protein
MPDPVKAGLVVSLNRPGGNMTGTAALTAELDAKRLEILRELVPYGDLIGALVNPNRPDAKAQSRDVQEAARALGQQVSVFNAGSEHDIDAVFAALGRQRITALLIVADPFFTSRHAQLAELTARHNVPALYATRDFATSGGLVSYGSRIPDGYRQAGIYVGQILKGSKPPILSWSVNGSRSGSAEPGCHRGPVAGTNVATGSRARPPDGYTLLAVSPANAAVINATLYEKLNFNFIR